MKEGIWAGGLCVVVLWALALCFRFVLIFWSLSFLAVLG